MVGLGCLVYVHSSIVDHVIHFETKKLMLGFKGIHGNKGSITLKFKIFNSMVSFTNVHLFSGQKEVDKRAYGLQKVEQNLPKSDYHFMMGDFNFRTQIKEFEYHKSMQESGYLLNQHKMGFDFLQKKDEVILGLHPNLKSYYIEDRLSQYPSFKVEHSTEEWNIDQEKLDEGDK